MGDGAGKRVMKCEIWQQMTRRGLSGKGSRIEGCRDAEHDTKDSPGAVAVRAALSSAVQLGRARARRRSEQASRNGQSYEM
jgi:hypothetical protein